jgi:glycosyltransferase involved in cell wall biosynthesis
MEKNTEVQEVQQEVKQPSQNEVIDNAIGNLRENKFKTYFYCPPMNSPSGGIGVLLKAAKNLSDDGFDVTLVYEPRQDQKASYEASAKAKKQTDIFERFNPTWVDFDISNISILPLGDKKIKFSDGTEQDCIPLNVSPEDFLIIPEGFPDVMKKTMQVSCKRIVFAQSWFYVLNAMQPGEKWQHFGITDVISASDAISEYLVSVMPGLNIKDFKQGINREYFKVPEKISDKLPMVAFSASRGPENKLKTYNIIKTFYAFYPHLKWVRFQELEGMDREQFAERLGNCAFYLYTDDIAGFGTAPLEAMACGTHTIGWASFGGKEYMNNENGFWCNNGDIFQTAEIMGIAIDKWLNGDMDGGEIQGVYEETLSKYTTEGEKENILNLLNQYKDERIKELESLKQ